MAGKDQRYGVTFASSGGKVSHLRVLNVLRAMWFARRGGFKARVERQTLPVLWPFVWTPTRPDGGADGADPARPAHLVYSGSTGRRNAKGPLPVMICALDRAGSRGSRLPSLSIARADARNSILDTVYPDDGGRILNLSGKLKFFRAGFPTPNP